MQATNNPKCRNLSIDYLATMCKLLQLITIFHWILECCRRCFRGKDNETEHLLDAEAPGQAEDNEYETKVGT